MGDYFERVGESFGFAGRQNGKEARQGAVEKAADLLGVDPETLREALDGAQEDRLALEDSTKEGQ